MSECSLSIQNYTQMIFCSEDLKLPTHSFDSKNLWACTMACIWNIILSDLYAHWTWRCGDLDEASSPSHVDNRAGIIISVGYCRCWAASLHTLPSVSRGKIISGREPLAQSLNWKQPDRFQSTPTIHLVHNFQEVIKTLHPSSAKRNAVHMSNAS